MPPLCDTPESHTEALSFPCPQYSCPITVFTAHIHSWGLVDACIRP